MIHGLGCAAELVSQNLQKYQEAMKKTRDLLEKSLIVCIYFDLIFRVIEHKYICIYHQG